MPRVRTVSLNAFIGSSIQTPAAQTYRRFSDLVQLSPTEALTFLEERLETINDGAFSLQWDFKESQPSGWKVRDKPGHLHNRSGNLAFGDGHVEIAQFIDEAKVVRLCSGQNATVGKTGPLFIQLTAGRAIQFVGRCTSCLNDYLEPAV